MSLAAVFAGQYENWDGLPPWSTTEAALQLEPIVERRPVVERTRALHRFEVTLFERATEPRHVELWTAKGAKTISLVECGELSSSNLKESLVLLGEADLRLEDRLLHMSYLVEDFVYVGRGLALSIGRALAASQQPERVLLHVRLFPVMSRERYLTEIDDLGQSGMPRPTA